ncbi:hypothetical protein HOC35_02660 [Candidatus Woesearchaeota archaeon]|jgi:lipid-A-disaccharide synthase-like uncharacterized protein|nr:hypothetical protein [Candidatus Woesearchaeota archaeon]
MILGLIGLALLAIAWIPETIEIIRNKKEKIDWRFGVLYVLGSLVLAIYSYQIGDTIFVILNAFIFVMSSISLVYSLKK